MTGLVPPVLHDLGLSLTTKIRVLREKEKKQPQCQDTSTHITSIRGLISLIAALRARFCLFVTHLWNHLTSVCVSAAPWDRTQPPRVSPLEQTMPLRVKSSRLVWVSQNDCDLLDSCTTQCCCCCCFFSFIWKGLCEVCLHWWRRSQKTGPGRDKVENA